MLNKISLHDNGLPLLSEFSRLILHVEEHKSIHFECSDLILLPISIVRELMPKTKFKLADKIEAGEVIIELKASKMYFK
jgi:hypothetical protein